MYNIRLLLLVTCLTTISASDILLLSSVASISHSRWYGKLALLLANHGHQVVVLDTDKNFYEHPNITHRMMDKAYRWLKDVEEQVKSNPDGMDSIVEQNTPIDNLMTLADPTFIGCDALLKSDGTKKFIKEFKGKKFDLIIGDGFCESFYGFVTLFGDPPVIPACPYLEQTSEYLIGLLDNPSYVPLHMADFGTKMTFSERFINTFYTVINQLILYNYALPNIDKLIKEIFGESAPKFQDIVKNNVPLIMGGYSYVLEGAKPLPPNYIPIPGFHVEPPSPLPKDIKQFLDGAKQGAILFSMGSNFKSILMSEEKREMFLSIFKNIPQRVIWKLELENATNIPKNVMITEWLPQNDILGHPNVKAFISHGGLLGTQEAVYHGVPMLGLPLMYDQVFNMERLQRHGVAIRLFYKHLNRNYVSQQIDKILNDPSYMYNMKRLSAAFKDAPETPQQRALFWIEYVLRNSKIKKNYLRPASVDLKWYQLLLLDVIGFLLASIIALYMILKIFFRLITSLICGQSTKDNVTYVQRKKVQ